MEFNKINETLTVSGQITPEEVATLKERGFKSLIINRPDEEVEDSLASAAVMAAAEQHGLAAVYLPIYPGQFDAGLIADTRAALASMEAPIYAYCRSGTRSCFAWGLAQAGEMDGADIMAQAAGAGYDLSPVAAKLAGD